MITVMTSVGRAYLICAKASLSRPHSICSATLISSSSTSPPASSSPSSPKQSLASVTNAKCPLRIVITICHGIPLVEPRIDTKFLRVNSSIVSERRREKEDGWQFCCCRHVRPSRDAQKQCSDPELKLLESEQTPEPVIGWGEEHLLACDWFKSEENVIGPYPTILITLTGSSCDRLRRGDRKVKRRAYWTLAMAWDKSERRDEKAVKGWLITKGRVWIEVIAKSGSGSKSEKETIQVKIWLQLSRSRLEWNYPKSGLVGQIRIRIGDWDQFEAQCWAGESKSWLGGWGRLQARWIFSIHVMMIRLFSAGWWWQDDMMIKLMDGRMTQW